MATETLYVSGQGDECNIRNYKGAACPNHYQNVDESPGHDGDSSFVSSALADGAAWERDLYAIENHSVGSGTINWVRVYAVMKWIIGANSYGQVSIKSGGVAANSGNKTLTSSWATYYNEWATPPEGGSWDWDKIDALQAGVRLYAEGEKGAKAAYCTQVYVVVDYTEIVEYEESASDAIELDDTPVITKTVGLSLTDGLGIGDTPTTIGAFGMGVSDGLSLDETLLASLEIGLALVDGVEINDANAIIKVFETLVTDGLALHDSPVPKWIFNQSLTDGMSLNEVLDTLLEANNTVTDGVALSESLAQQLRVALTLSDGVALSDVDLIKVIVKAYWDFFTWA